MAYNPKPMRISSVKSIVITGAGGAFWQLRTSRVQLSKAMAERNAERDPLPWFKQARGGGCHSMVCMGGGTGTRYYRIAAPAAASRFTQKSNSA
jgi:hypothetical protein